MPKPYRLGLVVGKFSPLHKGHEFLIDAALAQCERVLILSYAKPTLDGCEPHKRRAWLETRFADAHVLVLDDTTLAGRADAPEWPPDDASDLAHRRFVGWLCHDLLGVRIDAVFTSEDYGPGFASELQRYYAQRQPAETPDGTNGANLVGSSLVGSSPQRSDVESVAVTHVAVDRARARVPISGTSVRADVHAARCWLSPHVYASFVERIVLLGGESSGKSTLARALAAHLDTVYVEEYGRTRWEQQDGKLELGDMLEIAERQIALEESTALRARRYLICDTSPLTTKLYSEMLFKHVEATLQELAERPYDWYVVCAPDFPFEQDGTRRDPKFRELQHHRYLNELERRGSPFVLVEGTVAQRVAQVAATLARGFV